MADNKQGTTVFDGNTVVDRLVDNGTSFFPPLFSSYNDKIRPIIDTIDKLRNLKVIEQGIPDPTIIVAGEHYSGKASLIESLVGIFPPFAREACSKVPLIMRLQNHPNIAPELVLKYQKKSIQIKKERLISEAINKATVEIAGVGKTIANVPLTLVVKKKGILDLTIIYLPGRYWHSVSEDKSRDIFEQISDITKEYINPKESIILKVSSVGHRLPCIRTSRTMDNREERTLAVISKCDQPCHIDLCKAIFENKFKIRNRYHFIRNRINDETHEEARIQETTLFETCYSLSKIEKSMVGIPALATRLANLHLVIILRCLPDIVKKINEGICALDLKLNQLPKNPISIIDALTAFMHMVGSLKETLQHILIKGEYDEYIDDKQMHCNARLIEMLDEYSKKLHSDFRFSDNFLVGELEVLKEANGIWLPLLVPHSAVLCLLERKLTSISTFPIDFINKVWDYLEIVCVSVLIDHHGNYPQLVSSMRKALQNVMEKMKVEFLERVTEMIEMEKTTIYTCDPDFVASYNKLMSNRDEFLKAMFNHREEINMEGHETINVKHLFSVPGNARDQAFDLKMRMTSYWEIVLKRLVDWMALELLFMVQKLVNKEMEMEMVKEVMLHGGGIEMMSEELSSTGKEMVRLQRSIGLFQKSQQIIEEVRMALLFQPTRGTI